VGEHDVACPFQVTLQRRTDGKRWAMLQVRVRLGKLRGRMDQTTALGSSAPGEDFFLPSLLSPEQILSIREHIYETLELRFSRSLTSLQTLTF
jgi:hypothetical protein